MSRLKSHRQSPSPTQLPNSSTSSTSAANKSPLPPHKLKFKLKLKLKLKTSPQTHRCCCQCCRTRHPIQGHHRPGGSLAAELVLRLHRLLERPREFPLPHSPHSHTCKHRPLLREDGSHYLHFTMPQALSSHPPILIQQLD